MSQSLAEQPAARALGGTLTATPDGRQRPIQVMIVDDHELVRTGLTALLGNEEGLRIVGAAASGEEALRELETSRPDVVLLDYRLPGMNGAVVCAKILERYPRIAIIILTTYAEDDIIHACLVAGARGYLLKDASCRDLAYAIKTVSREESVLAPQVTEKVVSWARTSRNLIQGHESLDAVERTILSLVSEGMSNPAIAAQLNCSAQNVKLKLRSIMAKLSVTKRSEAVAVGIRRGLI